jgi:ATP-dependent Lon protease
MIRSKRYPDTLKERVLFFDEVQDKLDQYVADLMEMYDPKVKGLLAQAKEDGYWQELPRIEWMNDIFNSVKRESKRKNMKKEMIEDIFQSVYQENREFYYYTRRKNKELQSSLLSNLYEELNPILEDLDKSGYTKEVKEKISGLKKKTDDLKWGIF